MVTWVSRQNKASEFVTSLPALVINRYSRHLRGLRKTLEAVAVRTSGNTELTFVVAK